MAATGTSLSYDKQVAGNSKLDGINLAKLHMAVFEYVNSGTAATIAEILMGLLPAGKVRVFPQLCRLEVSENGADESFVDGAVIDVGFGAYTEPDGDAITADPNYWVAALNPASVHEKRFALPAGGGASDAGMSQVFESKNGLPITAAVSTQNMKVGAKIRLEIGYSRS